MTEILHGTSADGQGAAGSRVESEGRCEAESGSAWAGAAPAGIAGSESGASMNLTQERWLAKSRWARFGLCVAPLVATFVALELIAWLIIVGLTDQLALGIWLLLAVFALLPAALAGGLGTAAVLALTDSRRGIGFTMLGALGGAVLIIAVPLLNDVLT